jgi:hypothetical protein
MIVDLGKAALLDPTDAGTLGHLGEAFEELGDKKQVFASCALTSMPKSVSKKLGRRVGPSILSSWA